MSGPWEVLEHRDVTRARLANEALRADIDAAVVTTLLFALVAAPLGLLWAAVRPHSDLFELVDQDAQQRQHLSADLRYGVIALVAGLLVGAIAWAVARRGGTGVVIGLTIGGLLAAVIAARVGVLAAHQDHLRAQLAASFHVHGYDLSAQQPDDQETFLINTRFHLRAWGLGALLPAAAVGAFGFLTALSDRTVPRFHVGSRWDGPAAPWTGWDSTRADRRSERISSG
jgi:hypothetical protein